MNIKQVIVIRKDLSMRRGKEIAQGSHGSLAFLKNKLLNECSNQEVNYGLRCDNVVLDAVEYDWLVNGQKKICVAVQSEKDLIDIFEKASDAKLPVHLITDLGLTEFDGVPTKTCLCIGPAESAEIDKITGGLRLY